MMQFIFNLDTFLLICMIITILCIIILFIMNHPKIECYLLHSKHIIDINKKVSYIYKNNKLTCKQYKCTKCGNTFYAKSKKSLIRKNYNPTIFDLIQHYPF